MAAKANYFKLGLFILGAIAVVIAVVLALGAGALFTQRTYMETYFNTSVQGLEVGSPVKYRGVKLGAVSEITFTYAHYEQDKPFAERKAYVMIVASVQPELIEVRPDLDQKRLEKVIERGLRVRITGQGLTGTNYLELDFVDPSQNPPPPIDWVPERLYIPSAPGTRARLTGAAEALAQRLQRLDVEGLLANIEKLAVTANAKLEQLPVTEVAGNTAALLAEVRETNRQMQRILADPNLATATRDAAAAMARLRRIVESEQLKAIPVDTAAAVAQLRRLTESEEWQRPIAQLSQTLQRLDRVLVGREDDIAQTADNLRRLSENLRELSEDLKRYPAQILSGPPTRARR